MENENKVNLEEKVGIKLSKVTKAALRHDQKKAERAAAKAAKKAAYEALTDDEKKALKKARTLKVGAEIVGGLAAAGAIVFGTLKIAAGQRVEEEAQIEAAPFEETSDESVEDYPVE